MQPETLSRRTLIVGAIAGLTFSLALFLDFIQPDGSLLPENAMALPIQQEQEGFGLPMRLRIPKIDVDSVVEHVGLASDGSIGVPKERDNVAWFELGQRPGEKGGSVIIGHYGINNKRTSVFDNLYRLRKGDKIYVEDENRVIITFVVRESRRYDPEANSSAIFGPNDGNAHLNLVTCEGIWDESTQQYSKRLVVFTDRETE